MRYGITQRPADAFQNLRRLNSFLDEAMNGFPFSSESGALTAAWTPAVDVFEEAAQWLGAQLGADVRDALGGATPFLRLASQTVGGWLLGGAALVAQRELDAGRGDRAYLEGKVVTARFYADNLLPLVKGLLDPVRAGAADLLALEPAQF